MLRQSINQGYRSHVELAGDPDLSTLSGRPELGMMMSAPSFLTAPFAR